MLKIILLSLLSLFILSACGTWHGFGKDVSKVGASIQRSGKR